MIELMPLRTRAFLGVLFLSILALWDRPVSTAAFLAGAFLLSAFELYQRNISRPKLAIFVISLFAILPLWSIQQLVTHVAVYPQPARIGALAVLSYLCVVFIATGIPAGAAHSVRLAMLWFAFVLAVFAIFQNLTSNLKAYWVFTVEHTNQYLMGPFVYHNHWAVFIEISLPLAIYYALRTHGSWSWLYAAMAAALYGSVIVSASRSGTIICTIEAIALPLLVSRKALLPIIGALVLGTAIAGPEGVWQRLQTDPTIARADFNQTSLIMFQVHPVSGFGLGAWPIVYPQFAHVDLGTFVNQAHNDWLQWAVEGGAFYVLTWLAITAIACRQAFRFPWAIGVPAVFCQALLDYPFQRAPVAAWTLLILGLALTARSAPDPESTS